MQKIYYFPIIKTRNSELNAFSDLPDEFKHNICPIIEMTGALSYTYPKNYKVESLRHTKRQGNIFNKINKILSVVGNNKFILDITSDPNLMYDGLSANTNGLLSPQHGYENWINFLLKDSNFKSQVIPTIQFDMEHRQDVTTQIKTLKENFDYISLRLPFYIYDNNELSYNYLIPKIITWISSILSLNKLILIIDIGYIKHFEECKDSILNFMRTEKMENSLLNLKGIIPLSSSFPSFVTKVEKPIACQENTVTLFLKNIYNALPFFHGDYASIHPIKYNIGGGGWIPRIDYIVSDNKYCPCYYDYVRAEKELRNDSSAYVNLAQQVLSMPNYKATIIDNNIIAPDLYIQSKANGNKEFGKSPSFWIANRACTYMMLETIYLKKQFQENFLYL